MPLFIHKVIKIKHHDRTVSVSVVQVLVVGTTTYKNMVMVGDKLVPLREYLGD